MRVEEARWIEAARSGDVQAFNRLVILHQASAYGLAFRMLRREDAASDATQDAFLSAFTHLHQFRGGSFKAWLLRIVLNQVYDQLRRLQRHPSDSLDTLAYDEDAPVLQAPDPAPGPEDVALTSELRVCLEKGLRTLPPDQRAVVILCDIQGLSYEEAATATDTNLGTIKSRLSRGRMSMRRYLADHVELLPGNVRHYFESGEKGTAAAIPADG